MNKPLNSILQTIGNTPVIRINRLAPEGINLYVKCEAFNPMGSVKDRMAVRMIEQAETDGVLKPGQTVIEATSGNTGIGLAMVCAAKGYPLVLTMAESFSIERRRILRFLGARVVLTPAEEKGTGMLNKAIELAEKHDWFLARQFDNEANADAHSNTTAVEILETFSDQRLDYFVTGYGTGGTLKGTARVLRDKSPETRIVVCEPDNSQLLGSGIPQDRNSDGSAAQSHPNFRPHLMQGWTPDFIPKLAEDAVEQNWIDEIVPVNGQHSLQMALDLARKEGIFCGTSGGATFSGALMVAASAPAGSTILCMLPDTGERYLSTPLFEQISAEMNTEELEISQSTPGYRFDANSKPKKERSQADAKAKAAEPTTSVELNQTAVDFFRSAISDSGEPVVLFALEWCEFCWSVRKLFAELDLPYRSVDLDSVAYQKNDLGGKIRAVLNEQTGSPTIPQVYVGGKHVGGATDLFEAYRSGEFQDALKSLDVDYREQADLDPYQLLPGWLHKRG